MFHSGLLALLPLLNSPCFAYRYGEFTQLCGVLTKYIRPTDSILVAGCGNSDLSANLYDVGFRSIVNVDISETVVQQMTAKHAEIRPDMKFVQMDLLQVGRMQVMDSSMEFFAVTYHGNGSITSSFHNNYIQSCA